MSDHSGRSSLFAAAIAAAVLATCSVKSRADTAARDLQTPAQAARATPKAAPANAVAAQVSRHRAATAAGAAYFAANAGAAGVTAASPGHYP